mgnify:CR=1 FL=1
MKNDLQQSSLIDLLLANQNAFSQPEVESLHSIPGELVRELSTTGILKIPFVGTFEMVDHLVRFSPDPSLVLALNVSHLGLPVLGIESDPISEPSQLDETKKGDVQSLTPAHGSPNASGVAKKKPTSTSDNNAAVERSGPKPAHSSRRGRGSTSLYRERNGSNKGAFIIVALVAMAVVATLLLKPLFFPGKTVPNEEMASFKPNNEPVTALDSTGVVASDSSLIMRAGTNAVPDDSDPGGSDLSGSDPNGVDPTTLDVTAVQTKNITSETKGYTIIVRSTLSASAAEMARQELSFLNLPMGVLIGEVDGVTRYRMGLGIYTTALEADSVRISLGSQLPNGSWATRIR